MLADPSRTQDPHTFLDDYRQHHAVDVLEVHGEIGTDQDTTALVYELAAADRDEMVICPRVDGLPAGLVTNIFASRTRIARMLSTDTAELHRTFQDRAGNLLEPKEVTGGPLETRSAGSAVDVSTIPMVRHFASDRGPYITSGIVVAEDPDSGHANLSYHRATPHSRTGLATSLHSRGHLWRMLSHAAEHGRALPVAMVIGGHPLFMLAASARVPFGVDERWIAGGLFGSPLEIVRTPKYGLGVPATADFVLEGFIDPRATVPEGPFGEFSGYSSDRSTNNLLEVESILSRRDPWLLSVTGGNSADHLNLARIPREAEMVAKLVDRFPDVAGVHYPTSGTHFHAYVALHQGRPGQARQILLALLGWDPYLKTAVAVDEDVDITDDSEVLWAMATHMQPALDLFTVDGLPGSPLDPSSSAEGTTSRLGIDATRAPGFAGHRPVLSDDARARAGALLEGAASRR